MICVLLAMSLWVIHGLTSPLRLTQAFYNIVPAVSVATPVLSSPHVGRKLPLSDSAPHRPESDLVVGISETPPSSAPHQSASSLGLTSLPVAFLISEAHPDSFTADEDSIITGAQEQFVASMGQEPSQDPTSADYYCHWLRARQHCDDWLRIRLGHEGFNRFSSIAAQTLEQQKRLRER